MIQSLFLAICFFMMVTPVSGEDVQVKGHYRKDGTYVQPYTRSAPDQYKSNNYGRPNSDQRNGGSPQLRDYDRDGVYNQFDMDDDNDGTLDDFER